MSEVDIAGKIAEIEDVAPFPDLEKVWYWSIGGGWFTYTVALSSDGRSVFQMTCRDTYPAALVRDVLSFARHNESALLAAAPMAHVEGFDVAGHGFDSVGAVIPAVAEANKDRPEISAVTYLVFPGWRNEFSGAETEPEAYSRLRMLDAANPKREPMPFLKMRFDNGHSHTVGDERLLTKPDFFFDELAAMAEGSRKSFIEAENFRGELRTITCDDDGYVIDGGEARMSAEDARAWAERYLTEGDA
ncbi:hypothetical protein [Phytomonospora endophytica]|uniref:Uncharacterized protein n=1 Tax=Phytomonospora endophytica TaxID=714109 RepID=A0A841FN65_9ACTN|nr:hypothetical protein [Phytomonospora endophytica]MBB6037546.1 hypothetical protein [Phytomonospora endophytica]GIG70247.1 hypothetical protein Pen01_65420 [Phytomonospora endophytica]